MRRNLDQNSLFHALARDIATHLTKDAEERNARLKPGEKKFKACSEKMVKAMVQELFGLRKEIEVGPVKREVIVPTSSLTISEMSELTEKMMAWAATDLNFNFEERAA